MIQMSDKRESLDALTNIWTAETAGRLIGHYLMQSEEPGETPFFCWSLQAGRPIRLSMETRQPKLW